MIPISFAESNLVLDKPPSMTRDQCDPLNVLYFQKQGAIISCWKLTVEELEEIKKTGRIWLNVRGHVMPPVSLTTKQPFKVT